MGLYVGSKFSIGFACKKHLTPRYEQQQCGWGLLLERLTKMNGGSLMIGHEVLWSHDDQTPLLVGRLFYWTLGPNRASMNPEAVEER